MVADRRPTAVYCGTGPLTGGRAVSDGRDRYLAAAGEGPTLSGAPAPTP